jgi:hypothetical protein
MKLTEYEKEVIYRALDNYIIILSSKEDASTEHEIKIAKEIRSTINLESKQTQPKTTSELIEAIRYAHTHAHDNPILIGPGFFPFKKDDKDM